MDGANRENVRSPAVAGQFYPDNPQKLESQVRSYLVEPEATVGVIGAVMPHAGSIYSGAVAGETASHLDVPGRVIVLGPNHTGLGPAVSVFPAGSWTFPFGEIPVDRDLASKIIEATGLAEADEIAHVREHSIEVQLPFLHYRRGEDFAFVPMTLSMINTDKCRRIGEGLADVILDSDDDILMVASSDMTHYESHDSAKAKDSEAIDRILDLDPVGLLDTVSSLRISMCGVIPTAVMLFAANALGAAKARLIRYTTSGEISGDYDHVVGYAGVVVYK